MGRTPQLPPGTPTAVNGWHYDPDPYNGNAWFGPTRDTAVFVYPVSISNETTIWLKDERVSGVNHVELVRTSYEHAVEIAVRWMRTTRPDEWAHPLVCDAAFHPPDGWTLERYQLGRRRDTIRYVREETPPDCLKQVLQLQGYRSTGNYEFGVVEIPTERAAHVGDLLDQQVPDGSNLEIALAMMFDHAADVVDHQSGREPAGQTTFNTFQNA